VRLAHGEHERVVGVEHRRVAGRLDQLALGLRDPLAAAELPEVGRADVEHDATCGGTMPHRKAMWPIPRAEYSSAA
jgi:hypothetical protein